MPARILVVDDYPVNVILLAEWLAHEHYVVSTAADGFQALTIIEAEEPDIVLLDVMMPELDGFEVCKRIKSESGHGAHSGHHGDGPRGRRRPRERLRG